MTVGWRTKFLLALSVCALALAAPVGTGESLAAEEPSSAKPLRSAPGTPTPGTADPGVGCPAKAPRGTLRDGSQRIGAYNLCVEAVLAAPSKEAAQAIRFALGNLGVPYVTSNATAIQQRDSRGFFDCSSFVSRAYASAGIPATVAGGRSPNTTELRDSVTWAIRIPAAAAKPGDIAVFATKQGMHAVMLLPRGLIAHTNNFGDVSHVASAKRYPQLGTSYTTYLRVVK